MNLGHGDKLEKKVLKVSRRGSRSPHNAEFGLFTWCYWSFHVLFSVVSTAIADAVFLNFLVNGVDSPPGPKGRGHCEEMTVGGVATLVDEVNFTIDVTS